MNADAEFVFEVVAAERRHIAKLIHGLNNAELATPQLARGLQHQDCGCAHTQQNYRWPARPPRPRGSLARVIHLL